MELWIRSQGKECLTKVSHLFVSRYNTIKQDDDIDLASYETRERALEVLDEIQDMLKPRNLIYTGDKLPIKDAAHLVKMTNSESISMLPSNASITQLGVLVYEMPKE